MRTRIEGLLEGLGHFTYRRAWPVLIVSLALIAAGASQIPSIEIRTSVDEFLASGDDTREVYDAFLAEFGRDDIIFVAVETPEIFSADFVARLRDLHEALEDEVPHLHEVQSLVNARRTRGEDDALVVGELFEDWPEDPEALARLREEALANPLYVDFILSRDAKLTIVSVELSAFAESFDDDSAFTGWEEDASFGAPEGGAASEPGPPERPRGLSGAQEAEAVAAIESVVDRFQAPGFRIYAGGMPVLNVAMMSALIGGVMRFTVLSTVMIAFFLALVFRRALGVLIPLGIAILSVVATLGMMALLGIPAMPVSETVPSFLLAIAVGSSVHLIVIFLQRIDRGDSREDAIAGALAHSGLPIVMTGLTTAGGIASFAAASLLPIAIFGVVAAARHPDLARRHAGTHAGAAGADPDEDAAGAARGRRHVALRSECSREPARSRPVGPVS